MAEVNEQNPSFGTCLICLDPLLKLEQRQFLPCAHQFHENCISTWLKGKTICPTCKFSIYVSIDPEHPEIIPEEYVNPPESRTLAVIEAEENEQRDILHSIQNQNLGYGNSINSVYSLFNYIDQIQDAIASQVNQPLDIQAGHQLENKADEIQLENNQLENSQVGHQVESQEDPQENPSLHNPQNYPVEWPPLDGSEGSPQSYQLLSSFLVNTRNRLSYFLAEEMGYYQYPQNNQGFPAEDQYPQNNQGFPAEDQYPQNNQGFPAEDQYPQNNQGFPAEDQYPQNNQGFPAEDQYPQNNQGFPAEDQYPQNNQEAQQSQEEPNNQAAQNRLDDFHEEFHE